MTSVSLIQEKMRIGKSKKEEDSSKIGKPKKQLLKHSSFRKLKRETRLSLLSNRLYLLNKTIPLQWLNESLCTFKVKCKELMKL